MYQLTSDNPGSQFIYIKNQAHWAKSEFNGFAVGEVSGFSVQVSVFLFFPLTPDT
jgi:hypothetical protein